MIGAIIVLYHPKENLLSRLLNSLENQVNRIYIIDNTTINAINNYNTHFDSHKIFYKSLGKNHGIAKAQNEGINLALADGCEHVLLLDQDSYLSSDMVSELVNTEKKLKESGKKVAAIGPLFIDEKNGLAASAIRHSFMHVKKISANTNTTHPIEADYIISSGSLINATTLKEIGLMMEELFIDWVDIEWGLRAKNKGYSCFINPSTIMNHSIGDETVSVAGKSINLHNTIRNYYIVRNATYLLRKKHMGWNWRSTTLLKIPQYIVFYSLHDPKKLRSLYVLTKAFLHGLIGKTGPIPS
ncbi:glycosyltransferase family 2 protein [Vogesella indigofera]|uniref:glycosyltransferase family 2 protein n=1 Tax=Vogesella indigofera TaxID=45465 RepID=UPI00234F2C6B|nr:glycosyltransferase family 2 protein [Vogesella indigofera]MDC7711985.1 glycosyltransferase family 2 protein [Vogesella indigofera]